VVVFAMIAATSTVRVNAADSPNSAESTKGAESSRSMEATAATSSATATSSANSSTAAPADSAPPANPGATPNSRPAKKKIVKVQKDPAEESGEDLSADVSINEEDIDRLAKDSADEEVLAIRAGDSHIMINSGQFFGLHTPAGGDYIYFQHNGKPYLIQDPKIIAKAQALLAPSKELREKQRELGNQQRILGQQQRMLATQERTLARDNAIKMVQTPEFKRDMEELRKRLKDVDLPQVTAQIDERALADVQAHLAEIQSRVSRMQFEIGFKGHSFDDMGKFGEQMGKLGEQQGKLGEEQAKLGEQQRKIIEDATKQLKPIIEQAVREGTAKPIAP